jgi:putative ABC transport system permease protein
VPYSSNMLRSIWRSLARDPGFTATAVATLALGIGANTAMFSIIDGVLLKPLGYREPDRLVALDEAPVLTANSGLGIAAAAIGPLWTPYYYLWRDYATTLESIALIRPGTVNLTGAGEPERLLSAHVSASLLPTLGVEPALGRPFAPHEDVYQGPRLAILSHGFWRRRFPADPAILGRKIGLNGEPYEVIGVMPAGFELPLDLQTAHASHFDVLLPADIEPGEMKTRNAFWCVARLKPGVTVEQARAQLDGILRSGATAWKVTRKTEMVPLRSDLTARVEGGLSLLMAAVGLVLLTACANLANLLLGRGLTRRREIAVRAALGAGRARIMWQLFSEGIALSTLGGGAGALAAGWMLEAILSQLPRELPHRGAISVDSRALIFCLAVTVAAALLFAALPAWRFSKADPQEALRESQRGATETRTSGVLRRWLIAGQVALCTMLLIASGLLLRSFAKVLRIDCGFETENVVTAEVPIEGARYAGSSDLVIQRREQGGETALHSGTYRAIEERLTAVPGVSAAGAVSWLPLSGMHYEHPVLLPGVPLAPDLSNLALALIRFATPGYFRAAGIPLRSGRIYSDAAADMWSAVVSESLTRSLWPERDPIGREFTFEERPSLHTRTWRVVGVVADVRQSELRDAAPRTVYLSPVDNLGADLSFVIRTKLPLNTVAPAIRRAVAQVNPNVPVTAIRPMSDLVAASTAHSRFQILLLTSFAAVAVLLAALGIYGTLSYSVNQRYREIGIRLALGAQASEVRMLVLRQALTPVVLGLAAGCGGALLLMRAFSSLLYGVGFGDAVSYSAAGAIVLAVAVASSWLPARRAMRLDPVEAIRCE